MPPCKPTRQSLPHYLTEARAYQAGRPEDPLTSTRPPQRAPSSSRPHEDLGRFFRISKPYRGGRAIARPPGHGGRQVSFHCKIARPLEQAFTHEKLDALLACIADREPHLRLAV